MQKVKITSKFTKKLTRTKNTALIFLIVAIISLKTLHLDYVFVILNPKSNFVGYWSAGNFSSHLLIQFASFKLIVFNDLSA